MCGCFIFLALIYIATMSDTVDNNALIRIVNFIKNAIVSHANTPRIWATNQFFHA